MKKTFVTRLLWMGSVVVLAVGLGLTARTVGLIRATDSFLEDQSGDLKSLGKIADEMDRYLSARGAYEKVPGGRAVQLETILRESFSGDNIEDIRESKKDIADGWVMRKKEVVLKETPMSQVMVAIRKAEAQRPPWLLAECVIRAAPLTPGVGRVVLIFEALERSSSASQ